MLLTSKLIDGTFPDYERVIPTGNDKMLQVDCKSFAEAVDRVVDRLDREVARGEARPRPATAHADRSTSPESGTATEEIEVAL